MADGCHKLSWRERMLMNNFAALAVKTLPLVIGFFAPRVLDETTGEMSTPSTASSLCLG